jgi:hypothetical protein
VPWELDSFYHKFRVNRGRALTGLRRALGAFRVGKSGEITLRIWLDVTEILLARC